MPQCPNCGTELTADFGMVACPSCRAISVIDMDGNVQLDVPDPGGPPAGLQTPSEDRLSQDFSFEAPVEDAAPQVFDFGADIGPAPIEESVFEDLVPTFGATPVEGEVDPNIEANRTSQDLSDVAAYGNSDESLGRDGMYAFDVTIQGIDTKELRRDLRASLDDTRFLWDVNEIMGKIQNGTLVIRQLNSVKASILVNRLKGLPLDIQWKQNAIVHS